MKWTRVRSLSAYARAESHLVQKTKYGAIGMLLLLIRRYDAAALIGQPRTDIL